MIDVSDPKNPVLVGDISTGEYAKGVSTIEIRGIIHALVAFNDGNNGRLTIIQITDNKALYPYITSIIY